MDIKHMVGVEYGFKQLDLRYDPDNKAVWGILKNSGRPCMSLELLKELESAQRIIAKYAKQGYEEGDGNRLLYQIIVSDRPGVFSLGGDLAYFLELIRTGNRDALYEYAKLCIDVGHPSAVSYEIPFTTIALAEGETLGGGFEAALSANVLIAEQSATFGFPEITFGMFPGMGAFSFLARRLAPIEAKRIITSGKVFSAEELHEMGVVDVLVKDGNGRQAVKDIIKQRRFTYTGHQGLDIVVDQFNPLTYEELSGSIDIWVDTAMQVSEKNLRLMEYLLRAQERRWSDRDERVEEPVQTVIAI
jgi:DSF synthase